MNTLARTAAPDYRASMASPTTAEQTIARFRDKPLDFVHQALARLRLGPSSMCDAAPPR